MKEERGGMIGRVNLGLSGLNILWVLDWRKQNRFLQKFNQINTEWPKIELVKKYLLCKL